MFVHHYDAILVGTERATRWLALSLVRRSWQVLRVVYGPTGSTFRFSDYRLRRGTTVRSSAVGMWTRTVLDDLAANFLLRRWRPSQGTAASVLGDGLRFRMLPPGDELDREFLRQDNVLAGSHRLADWRRRASAQLGPALAMAADVAISGWFRRQLLTRALRSEEREAHKLCADYMNMWRDDARIRARFDAFEAAFDASTDEESLLRLESLVRMTGPAVEVIGGAETLNEWADEQLLRAHTTVVRAQRPPGLLSGHEGRVVIDIDGDLVGGDALVEFDESRFSTSLSQMGEGLSVRGPSWVPRVHRYAVCLVLRAEAFTSMHGLAMAVPSVAGSDLGALWCERYQPCDDPRLTGLVVTTDLPAEDPLHASKLGTMRERIVSRLESVIPYLARHLIVVDSVYDGLPLWDYRSGARLPIQRLSAGLPAVEPMPVRWRMGNGGLHSRVPWYRSLFAKRGGHWLANARCASRFDSEEPFVMAAVLGRALLGRYAQKRKELAPWRFH